MFIEGNKFSKLLKKIFDIHAKTAIEIEKKSCAGYCIHEFKIWCTWGRKGEYWFQNHKVVQKLTPRKNPNQCRVQGQRCDSEKNMWFKMENQEEEKNTYMTNNNLHNIHFFVVLLKMLCYPPAQNWSRAEIAVVKISLPNT